MIQEDQDLECAHLPEKCESVAAAAAAAAEPLPEEPQQRCSKGSKRRMAWGGALSLASFLNINYAAPLESRLASLLEKDGLTDVDFLIGESETRLSAHKLILAVSSPVFLSMFYGALGSESLIRVPDCEPEAFSTLIHYIYGSITSASSASSSLFLSEEPELSGRGEESTESKTLPILYAAHKYDVQGLQELCALKLSLTLNPWNVLSILKTAELYGLDDLQHKCWSLVQMNTRVVLNFHQHSIDFGVLQRIVQDPDLSIDEVKLFEFLNSWAENECEKEEVVPTVDNKLRRLGDMLVYIRFPTMSASDFANRVASKGLLTSEQVASVLTYICSSPQNRLFLRVEFPTTRRTGNREQQQQHECSSSRGNRSSNQEEDSSSSSYILNHPLSPRGGRGGHGFHSSSFQLQNPTLPPLLGTGSGSGSIFGSMFPGGATHPSSFTYGFGTQRRGSGFPPLLEPREDQLMAEMHERMVNYERMGGPTSSPPPTPPPPTLNNYMRFSLEAHHHHQQAAGPGPSSSSPQRSSPQPLLAMINGGPVPQSPLPRTRRGGNNSTTRRYNNNYQ